MHNTEEEKAKQYYIWSFPKLTHANTLENNKKKFKLFYQQTDSLC